MYLIHWIIIQCIKAPWLSCQFTGFSFLWFPLIIYVILLDYLYEISEHMLNWVLCFYKIIKKQYFKWCHHFSWWRIWQLVHLLWFGTRWGGKYSLIHFLSIIYFYEKIIFLDFWKANGHQRTKWIQIWRCIWWYYISNRYTSQPLWFIMFGRFSGRTTCIPKKVSCLLHFIIFDLIILFYYFRMEIPRFRVLQSKNPKKVIVKPNVSYFYCML